MTLHNLVVLVLQERDTEARTDFVEIEHFDPHLEELAADEVGFVEDGVGDHFLIASVELLFYFGVDLLLRQGLALRLLLVHV